MNETPKTNVRSMPSEDMTQEEKTTNQDSTIPKDKSNTKNLWIRSIFGSYSESENGSEDQPNGSDQDQEPIAEIADEDASVDAELHVTSYKEEIEVLNSYNNFGSPHAPSFLTTLKYTSTDVIREISWVKKRNKSTPTFNFDWSMDGFGKNTK